MLLEGVEKSSYISFKKKYKRVFVCVCVRVCVCMCNLHSWHELAVTAETQSVGTWSRWDADLGPGGWWGGCRSHPKVRGWSLEATQVRSLSCRLFLQPWEHDSSINGQKGGRGRATFPGIDWVTVRLLLTVEENPIPCCWNPTLCVSPRQLRVGLNVLHSYLRIRGQSHSSQPPWEKEMPDLTHTPWSSKPHVRRDVTLINAAWFPLQIRPGRHGKGQQAPSSECTRYRLRKTLPTASSSWEGRCFFMRNEQLQACKGQKQTPQSWC